MDSNATQSLVSQMTDLIWRNLSRTVENNRMVSSVQTDVWDMGHGRFYHEYRSGKSEYPDNEPTDKLVQADNRVKNPKIKNLVQHQEALEKSKTMEAIKMTMLISEINKQ